MNRRLLSLALIAALTSPAIADTQNVLVLQTEGRADGALRAKVDARVLELARSTGAKVAPGDITFTHAAAAVGCKPSVPACKDEVLEMLGVDEVVFTTITPKPGGHEVLVQRVSKGGVTRDARATIKGGDGADLAEVAPLFGGAAPAITTAPTPTTTPPPSGPSSNDPGPMGDSTPYDTAPLPTATEPTAPIVSTRPTSSNAGPERDHLHRSSTREKLPVIGMVGGGAMALIGFMLWGKAGDINDEIDAAPTRTLADLQALADLEGRGSSYAGWGNVMFLGGAVLGGVSTYYFLKDRKRARRASSARVMPTVFDHGAGIALTIGGSP